MKIAYLASALVPSREANSIQVMKMTNAFRKNGHDVLLVLPCFKPGTEESVSDLASFYGIGHMPKISRVPWLPVKGRGVFFGLFAAIRARIYRPDVVYTRYPRAGYFACLLGIPVIFEIHAPQSDWSFLPLIKNPRLQYIVAISDALRVHLLDCHQVELDKVVVAHDGAELSPECPTDFSVIDPTRMNVAYAGHLYSGKGMELIAKLARDNNWISMHIFGGKPSDIAYWKEETADIENLVFHGFVPTSSVQSRLRNMDALIAPYQPKVASAKGQDIAKWMSPLKLFDYMACAVPIVASDLPVLREVLTHEQNALLCPPSAPEKWASELRRIYDDPDLSERLSRNAFEDFVERYTWSKRAERVIERLVASDD